MTDDSGLPDRPQEGPSFPLALGAGAAVAVATYPLLGWFGCLPAGGTAFFAVGLVRPGYSPVRPLAWGVLVGALFAAGVLAPDPVAQVSYAAGAILLFAGVLLPTFRDRWLRPSGAPPEGVEEAERAPDSDERIRLELVKVLHSDHADANPTPLERAAISSLLAPAHPVTDALRRQAAQCRVVSREFTGVGFYTNLAVEPGVPPAPVRPGTMTLGDATATIDGLRHGAAILLWIKDGRLDVLEVVSYDEPWPNEVGAFEIEAGGVTHGGGSRPDLEVIEAAWIK